MTGKVWDFASWVYARGASAEAHLFLDVTKGSASGVWYRVELPTLEKRAVDIIYHTK